ncbi:hypothetical protein FNU3_16 [Fusobacterium phage vB_FnuS_FNU3]|uniref:Uncharacterized protein n=1 Tax=Fusobacterium phage Fnu1 TaxID=2530024 RepID=A0A481W6T4_9CAUD|nr:hypothetical protein KMD24_gp023 [Fusobacterium phage Fnu1]QBJ04111.1 hypothetical protein [Fusobacterium phage Fnu1]WGH50239.1 hypothetical protein FNU2_133 [Fusobacterium phage vB_FnuS_FNU2]WGH50382.1 hypothetical protein FNU3_16 [Fusobacterium phage vB_FnuS_FNU3]
MIELNTLLYHLNKQIIKDNLPYYFTDDVLIQEPLKFKIIEQNNNEIIVEIDNNTKVTNDMFLNKTFKYGTNTFNILNVVISDKITLQLDKTNKLPKRSFTLEQKQPILIKANYSYSREQSGNTFNTFKRFDFGVAYNSDKEGKLYDIIHAYVELFLYKKRKLLQVYDKENNQLVRNKYVFIESNVTTSNFIENRDNVYRTFYILVKTFNNI